MPSLKDLLSLLDIGGLFEGLLPDDYTRLDQYYRATGTVMMFLGIIALLIFIPWSIVSGLNFTSAILLSVALIFVGIIIQVAAYFKGEENRKIDRDKRRKEVDEATADLDPDRIVSEAFREQDDQRLTVKERREKMKSPSSDVVTERTDRTVTIEPITEEPSEDQSREQETVEEEYTNELEYEE